MSVDSAQSRARSDRMIALILLLHQNGALPLSSLARRLRASEATIRRDVSELASQQLLERTHGGARPIRGTHHLPERLRECINLRAKNRIAATAACMIEPSAQSIGLTGGSTTRRVLMSLGGRKDLTIITNSLSIGSEAVEQRQRQTLVVGGVLRPSSLELVGPLAEAAVGSVGLGTAVVGADGFSTVHGLTRHDEMAVPFHRTLIAKASRVIVVADSSKIGTSAAAPVCDLSSVDHLVTDSEASAEEVMLIRAAGVDVTVVKI